VENAWKNKLDVRFWLVNIFRRLRGMWQESAKLMFREIVEWDINCIELAQVGFNIRFL
jgi:hypothetical protein